MSIPSGLPSTNPSSSFWHTEPSSLLLGHRTTEDLPTEADIVVVGTGISGASVVHHSLEKLKTRAEEGERKKLNVLVLEAREVCWGATGRNGGHCQPIFYEHPQDPSIGTFELSNFLSLQSHITKNSISCEWHTQPGIRALYSATDLQGAITAVKVLQQNDAELARHVKVVTDEREVRKLGLRTPGAVGAVVTDVAARLWPYKFVARVWEDLLRETDTATSPVHLNLQTHTPVTSLTQSTTTSTPSWTLTTPRGEITTPKVILATNAHTSHLLPSLSDLILPCRGQMSSLIPSESFSGGNRTTSSFGFIGPKQDDYLIQRPDEKGGHLMFGGGRCFGPSLGISSDDEVDENVARYLRRGVPKLLGGGKANEGAEGDEMQATHEWTGIMGFSRDNLPWVGEVPGSKGVWVVGGYTGHGMPNAWLCGRAIATMLSASAGDGPSAAVEEGLPRAYLVTEERIRQAREMNTVEVQDGDHMFKAEATA